MGTLLFFGAAIGSPGWHEMVGNRCTGKQGCPHFPSQKLHPSQVQLRDWRAIAEQTDCPSTVQSE
jgi:hypothetical protein